MAVGERSKLAPSRKTRSMCSRACTPMAPMAPRAGASHQRSNGAGLKATGATMTLLEAYP